MFQKSLTLTISRLRWKNVMITGQMVGSPPGDPGSEDDQVPGIHAVAFSSTGVGIWTNQNLHAMIHGERGADKPGGRGFPDRPDILGPTEDEG